MVKDKTIETTSSAKPMDEVTPQASPIIREPRFGRRNSALETEANDLTLCNMALSKSNQYINESRESPQISGDYCTFESSEASGRMKQELSVFD